MNTLPTSAAPDSTSRLVELIRAALNMPPAHGVSEQALRTHVHETLRALGLQVRERALAGPAFGRDPHALLVDNRVAVVACSSGNLRQLRQRVHDIAAEAAVQLLLCMGTPAWLWRIEGRHGGKPVLASRIVYRLTPTWAALPEDTPRWSPMEALRAIHQPPKSAA